MPVSDISVAMELRRRRRRKRNRIIAEVVAALVVLILVAIWIVRSSSLLCVDTIEVHGTHLLTASQVEQAAKVVKGQPLARVNTCLLYTSPSPRDQRGSRMPSSA